MSEVVPPKRIGEPQGEPAELVLDAITGRERRRVVRYLSRGAAMIAGGYLIDPVTDDPRHRIPNTVDTDGTWIWASPWAYFVDKYGAALPADFLQHIRALGYRPPKVSKERAREIGLAEGVIPPDSFFDEFEARQKKIDAAARAEYEARQAEEGSTQPE